MKDGRGSVVLEDFVWRVWEDFDLVVSVFLEGLVVSVLSVLEEDEVERGGAGGRGGGRGRDARTRG